MSDNIQLNAASTVGSTVAAASLTISGDTAWVQMIGCGLLSGSEGSWTYSQLVGGAGAVAAGVQRVTLASDDPAVVDLAALEVLLTAIDADTSRITACNTGAVVVASGTITSITNAVAVTGTFWQATQPVSGTFWQATQPVSLASPVGAGTEAAAIRVTVATDSTGVLSIDDNGGAITVDGTVAVTGTFWQATQPVSGTFWQTTQPVSLASPVGAGTEAAAIRVTLATDSTGVVSIDDNGGAITVDGTVAVTGTFWQATQPVSGTFWQATQPVSGTFWQATQPVSLASPVGAGTEAAAIRVTLATDSTGVVSIDDNGGAITVDGTVAVTGMTACNTGAVVLAAGTAEIGKLGAGTAEIGKLAAGTALIGKVGIDQSTANANEVVVKSGTVTTVSTVTNLSQLGGAAVPIGAGTEAAAVRVTLPTDGTGQVKLAAGSAGNCIGNVVASASNIVYDAVTSCVVKRASGIATAENANTMVAAVADYQIRVLALSLIATSATAVWLYIYNGDKMLLGDSTNEIVLDMDGVGGPAGLVLPWNPGGWFQTDTDNEALAIDLSAAQPVVWCVTYIEVT